MIFSTKKIIFLFVAAIVAGCSATPSPPKDAIEVQKMAQILADIHLTEAKISRVSFQSYDSSRIAYKELERRIFEKYKVDSASYKKTYDFYASNPEFMMKVYENVLKIIEDKKKKKSL